jgi:glutamyl-tRNA(Gln) amidotransferase subunit D
MQLKTGDIVVVDGKWKGTVMPSVDDEYIVLKAESGYNYSIKKKGAKFKKLGTAKKPRHKPVKMKITKNKDLPTISILSTGGTISSSIDYLTGAIKASYSAEDLVATVPELTKFVNLKSRKIMEIMSEDISAKHWIDMAKAIAKEKTDGVVITHGTDTLSYTASMLSFMLTTPKPIVLTYAQKSSDRGASDAFFNILCSAITAGHSDIAELVVCGHGTDADDYCIVNRGVNVRKMHASRRDAFRSINELPLARVWPNGNIEPLNNYEKHGKGNIKADTKIEERVAIVKFYANAKPDIFDFYIKKGYKGLVVEATGLGHVSIAGQKFVKGIQSAIDSRIPVVISSQTIYGHVNPSVYSNLRALAETGAIFAPMLTETAYTKLMWILGHTKNMTKVKEQMLTNMKGEIVERIDPRTFLY